MRRCRTCSVRDSRRGTKGGSAVGLHARSSHPCSYSVAHQASLKPEKPFILIACSAGRAGEATLLLLSPPTDHPARAHARLPCGDEFRATLVARCSLAPSCYFRRLRYAAARRRRRRETFRQRTQQWLRCVCHVRLILTVSPWRIASVRPSARAYLPGELSMFGPSLPNPPSIAQ